MDTRRLETFVRIVEMGSLTKAAAVLHVAQPALSQQLSGLESELGQQLLTRSKQGVKPTKAGELLYRHALVILKQLNDALADVELAGREVAGDVSLGLAPYSSANLIALPLLQLVRKRYPGIRLRIADNFGPVLSEAMMTGRLDLALLFDPGPMGGMEFEELLTEDLVLLRHQDQGAATEEGIDVTALGELPLMLPSPVHTIRKAVTSACEAKGTSPMVVAEVGSVELLGQAVEAGLGATLLPRSVAERMVQFRPLRLDPVSPRITVSLAMGTLGTMPLSRPAECVRDLLREVVAETLLS